MSKTFTRISMYGPLLEQPNKVFKKSSLWNNLEDTCSKMCLPPPTACLKLHPLDTLFWLKVVFTTAYFLSTYFLLSTVECSQKMPSLFLQWSKWSDIYIYTAPIPGNLDPHPNSLLSHSHLECRGKLEVARENIIRMQSWRHPRKGAGERSLLRYK